MGRHRMDRMHGASESVKNVMEFDFQPSNTAFDDAFSEEVMGETAKIYGCET